MMRDCMELNRKFCFTFSWYSYYINESNNLHFFGLVQDSCIPHKFSSQFIVHFLVINVVPAAELGFSSRM
jgi:hypothetical protein